MRYYVLTRQARSLSDGDFMFSTRGIYESFQDAADAARELWKLDERTMREWSDRAMFMISEHRIAKYPPRVSHDNRLAALRKWYWAPTKENVFFPVDDLRDLRDA